MELLFSKLAKPSTPMLVSGISRQLKTSVFILDALSKFSKIFSSSDDVCDVSIRVNYILLTVTDIFGKGK